MYPPINQMTSPWAYGTDPRAHYAGYAGGGFTGNPGVYTPPPMPPQEFSRPGFYSPGQVAFNSNPEMSQLISMVSPAIVQGLAGPDTFVPHLTQTMSTAEQYRTRNYQQEKFKSQFEVANDNTSNVADRFLGMTKLVSDTAAKDPLVQEQMSAIAEIANNPAAKMIMGQIMGEDNVEAMLHGREGDVAALNSKVGQMAYYMNDPSGVGKMSGESASSFSRGVYSHLYQPDIDVERTETDARSSDDAVRTRAKQKLKTAADNNKEILDDTEIVDRLVKDADSAKKTAELYTKYVSGGTETDSRKQAEALVSYDRAIKESGVLSRDESSISMAGRAAQDKAINNARGFMAGQVGQLAEHLQQQGRITSETANMTQEERVAAVAKTEVNDATYSRLGRELAKKAFSDTNNQSDEAREYRALQTQAEREAFIADKADPFEQQVRDTKAQAEKSTAGGAGAPTAEEIEQLDGFSNLTVNVDAEKTANTLEGYLDAVAAVRDIFGDNGNPNAPMSELIATLNGLTGGAQGQLSGSKVANQLRQMQTLAKETGTGQAELLQMHAQSDAMSRSLGLTAADAMRGTTGALLAKKVMTETGQFSNPSYGALDRAGATQLHQELSQRGQASATNQAALTMVALYESDPERFKGTELEAAAEAYKRGDMEYTDPATGEKVNLAQKLAVNPTEARRITRDSYVATGADAEQAAADFEQNYSATYAGVEKNRYQNDSSVERVQNENIKMRGAQRNAISVSQKMRESGAYDKLGIKDEAKQREIEIAISEKMADTFFEAEKLPEEEQAAFVQQQITEDIEQTLIDQGVPPGDARKQAEALTARGGRFDRSNVEGMRSGMRSNTTGLTGGKTLKQMSQVRGDDVVEGMGEERKRSAERADADNRLAEGYETTPLQRLSDYAKELAQEDENFTLDGLGEAVTGPQLTNEEFMRRVSPNMQNALNRVNAVEERAVVDVKEINAASAAAKQGSPDALRKLAGIADDTKILTAEEASTRSREIIRGMDDATLLEKVNRHGAKKVTAEELASNRQNYERQLYESDTFQLNDLPGLLDPKETTMEAAEIAAKQKLGKEAEGVTKKEADEAKKYRETMETALFGGKKEDIATAISALERNTDLGKTLFGNKVEFTDEQHNELTKLVGGKDVKREQFEALADDLGLKDDAKSAFVDQAAGLQEAQQSGGMAYAFRQQKEEDKLTDTMPDRIPLPAEKKDKPEDIKTETEKKKLADAGVVTAETTPEAKTPAADGAKPILSDAAADAIAARGEPDTTGAEKADETATEQISILKEIRDAIRALTGGNVNPATPATAEDVANLTPEQAANLLTPEDIESAVKSGEGGRDVVAGVRPDKATKQDTAILKTLQQGSALIENETPEERNKREENTANQLKDMLPQDIVTSTEAELIERGQSGEKIGTTERYKAFSAAAGNVLKERYQAQMSAKLEARRMGRDAGETRGEGQQAVEVKTLSDVAKKSPGGLFSSFVSPDRADTGPAAVSMSHTGETSVAFRRDLTSQFLPGGLDRTTSLYGDGVTYDRHASGPSAISADSTGEFAMNFRRDMRSSFLPGEAASDVLALSPSMTGTDSKGTGPNIPVQAGMLKELPETTTATTMIKEERVSNPAPQAANQVAGQNQKIEISGRISVDGLDSAILEAVGEQPMQTTGAPLMS